MFDELQKWSEYTTLFCKSHCVDHIHVVGFVKKRNVNFLKLKFQDFLSKCNLKKYQFFLKKLLLKNCNKFGIACAMPQYNFHYLILFILENHI